MRKWKMAGFVLAGAFFVAITPAWAQSISFDAHIANVGWVNGLTDKQVASGSNKLYEQKKLKEAIQHQLEAIRIRLNGMPGAHFMYSARGKYGVDGLGIRWRPGGHDRPPLRHRSSRDQARKCSLRMAHSLHDQAGILGLVRE